MIQSLLIGIALLASVFGLLRTPTPVWDTPSLQFGATNFPTSLDSLTNPSGTDSVATVSHSGQHSNANDALEALEAKLGINASTPVTDSIFVGTSAGGSQWSTFATTTRFAATNFLATGSSTLQNFTAVNSTTTSATTTNSFATTASSTNLYGASINGFSLSTCTGSSFVQWTGGSFGCATPTGTTAFSTTTAQNLATTTLKTSDGSLPDKTTWEITLVAPDVVGSASTTGQIRFYINGDFTFGNYSKRELRDGVQTNYSGVSPAQGANNVILLANSVVSGVQNSQRYVRLKIVNNTGMPKYVEALSWISATTTAGSFIQYDDSMFLWNNTAAITQIDIAHSVPNAVFATSTTFRVLGY